MVAQRVAPWREFATEPRASSAAHPRIVSAIGAEVTPSGLGSDRGHVALHESGVPRISMPAIGRQDGRRRSFEEGTGRQEFALHHELNLACHQATFPYARATDYRHEVAGGGAVLYA